MTEASRPADPNGTAHARPAPGTPCWVSLMAHGTTATQDFYQELFGWEFQPGAGQPGPYVRALLDGRQVAGVGHMPPDQELPVAWTPYFASDDADATAETVRHCGGTVGVGPLDAGADGRIAVAVDPTGAVFGIWQPTAHFGAEPTGAPGTPVWNELLTYESTGVTKFYRNVFGYEDDPTADASEAAGPSGLTHHDTLVDQVLLRRRGRPVAAVRGVGQALPRDRGAHWLTYFRVADVDAATARVTTLGGRVLTPPHDTPHGRTATVADPEGARLALLERAG
ncbi:VOC family protein [Streptomyces sp. B3I8]|uniref:VOC family protein n=1 Tax=Streptomyces sp. B3I8 TaxID=3042303 RepID=UPI0027856FF1|nr:VOC family protein [Streptomyces sp. B3I8]MDQ0789681.1 putative enzyme related to lactoylglutathione lyase [Streptomyces sp. B3I8]